MNVISISTDRNVFLPGSAVRQRMIEYGSTCAELHIVVFAKRKLGFRPERIAGNVWIYPTRSLSRLFYMRNAVRAARRIIAARGWKGRDFAVTCQDPFESGAVGVRLKKKYGCPLQLQIHTDFASPHFARSSHLNKIRVRMAMANLPHADEIRTVSPRVMKSVMAMGTDPSRIDVLPIYTDIAAIKKADPLDFKKMFPEFSFTILVASRLEKEKNVKFALDVFAETLKKYPRAGMIIVGKGSEETALAAYARKLGIEHGVVFAGWQTNLPSWYKSATVFLSTSLYEGYGLSLVEAAVAGAAIVVSDVGIAGDVLIDGKNAIVCAPYNVGVFVNGIARLISDNALRYGLQHAAPEIEKWLIADKAAYLAQYRKCLEKAFIRR